MLLILLTCAFASRVAGADAPATRPDTPAGALMFEWFDAVNSGDRDTIRRFVADHFARPTTGDFPIDGIADRLLARGRDSGGLEPVRIITSEPHRIAVLARTKRTGYWTEITMAVTLQPPHRILGTGQRGVEAPADLLPSEPLSDEEIHDRIDGLVSTLFDADAFSGVVMVAKDERPIYERAAGMASRAWGIENRVDTKFNVASLGKMFTAVAVAQLVERGRLSYDDTVGAILPDYPQKDVAAKVRVWHLLSHTSGLPSGGSQSDGLFAKRYRAVKDYLPSFAADAPAFEPGTKFLYSNCGYYLLGAIIEKASGQTYHDYVREHVYAPAGMTDTDNYDLDTDPPNLAVGYMDPPGGRGPRRSNTMRLPIRGVPCGLGYSTAGDLVKFHTALLDGKLLSPASLATVWTGRIDTDRGGQYGYGFHVREYNGARIVWHGGGWVGITNHFDMYPELGYTVVILCNIDNDPTSLAKKISEWLTQGTAAKRAE